MQVSLVTNDKYTRTLNKFLLFFLLYRFSACIMAIFPKSLYLYATIGVNGDLSLFFLFCRKGLKKNGIIVLKENITSSGKVEVDQNDSSVTRPLGLLRRLMKRSEMELFKEMQQPNLPKGLYTVKMFGLRPLKSTTEDTSEEQKAKNDIVNNENSIKLNLPTTE